MPTYDYECRDCRSRVEVSHGMTESGPSTCERCGGPMRRVLHPAGIIFRGSGFYKTDSRSSAASSTPSSTAATPGKEKASEPAAGDAETGRSPAPSSGGGDSPATVAPPKTAEGTG